MTDLSRRERVKRALNFQEPDRVPNDLGGRVSNIHVQTYRRLLEHLGYPADDILIDPFHSVMNISPSLLDRLGIDFQYLYLKAPEYIRIKEYEDSSYENEWGIRVKQLGIYSVRVSHPLADATKDDLRDFNWPDPNLPERVAGLRKKAEELYQETDYALIAAPISGGIFEFGQHLRGMEQFLLDLLMDKPFTSDLLDHLIDVQKGLWEVFLKEVGEYVEIVQLADDFGTQDSLIISPELFREFFKPRYTDLIRFIKERTAAKVFFHCDGAIFRLLDDFAEMGVEILNPLQPTAEGMDPAEIKDRYGKIFCFHGAIDNQHLLPEGTPDEIQEAVQSVIQALAPGGGYILASAHVLQPDIPDENILVMFDAAHTYGQYPI